MPRFRFARTALLALVTSGLLGCQVGSGVPTAPEAEAPFDRANARVAARPALFPLLDGLLTTTISTAEGLLSCFYQPYRSGSAIIGPEGGTMTVGEHVLRVPAGALPEPVLIRGQTIAGTYVVVDFGPDGLHFDQPAELTLDYGSCPLKLSTGTLGVVLVDGDLQIVTRLPSRDDRGNRRVTGRLEHFSRYAIAR